MTTKQTIKVERYILPDSWACYLMYGDSTGLTDEEIRAANIFVESLDGAYMVSKAEDSYFARSNDANNISGNVSEYQFHRLTN